MGGHEITGGNNYQEIKEMDPQEMDPQEVDPAVDLFGENTNDVLEQTHLQRHPIAKLLFVIVVGGIVAVAIYSAIASMF